MAVALRLVATVAVEMRKIRKGPGEQTVCGYTIERRMEIGAGRASSRVLEHKKRKHKQQLPPATDVAGVAGTLGT